MPKLKALTLAVSFLLTAASLPLQAVVPDPETFETYGSQNPWNPSFGAGWTLLPENSQNTFQIGNFGPSSGSGGDLAFRTVGAGNAGADWSATLDIDTFPQQQISFDFRLFAGDGTGQDRSRVSLKPAIGNHAGPGFVEFDIRNNALSAELLSGDDFSSGPGSFQQNWPMPLGGLTIGQVQGASAPWYSLEMELDYSRAQQAATFSGQLGQVRARVQRQDGSQDFGWSAWGDMGLDTGQYDRVSILRNGTADIDNVRLNAVGGSAPPSAGPFPVGWYDTLVNGNTSAGPLTSLGANFSLAYWGGITGVDDIRITNYLDAAQATGLNVVMGIDEARIASQDVAGIREIVSRFNDHPAVYGWYTADEPYWVWGVPVHVLQTAYDTIKLDSDKPVFIVLSTPGLERNAGVEYRNTYDVMMIDDYPFRLTGEPEFTGLDEVPGRCCGYPHNWKAAMQVADSQAQLASKPWWSVMEGWSQAAGETDKYRLPTFDEARFMNYWSLRTGAAGLLHFAYYRVNGGSPAYPDAPYPFDGDQWLLDVWSPLAQEINTLGPALLGGMVPAAVSDNRMDIEADLYHDSEQGDYFLVALNAEAGSENATFTLSLSDDILAVEPMFENGDTIVVGEDGSFSDLFSDYEVHVYKLVLATIPGDLNADNLVNAIDIDIHRNAVSTFSDDVIYDLNADQVVDTQDTNYLIATILGTKIGDVNLDRHIDALDMAIIRTNWGSSSNAWSDGNLFGNDVDNLDLTIVRGNYGYDNANAAPLSAPEPASITFLCLGALLGRRSREPYQGAAR